jgi:hypothetical protein
MPSQQQLLGRKARQEFLKQAIPPDTTPYFRYIIHCADSVLDMTHGGYDLEEMHLPEFSIYLNRGAMFFGDSERYQDASIKKIYYGYLNLDRRRLLNFIAEFRAIETARKQLSQKEELLNSDKKYLQNFLSQQIKVRDEDPCLTCHHSYYDHRRLWSRSEECGASYRHTEGPCQCTKFISGRPDFQDELRQEQYQKKKLS